MLAADTAGVFLEQAQSSHPIVTHQLILDDKNLNCAAGCRPLANIGSTMNYGRDVACI